MHFPLHKGTEVLIGFKGGDPDQPVIVGAVPNVSTPSPVTENNVSQNIIQTHGGNTIKMEDTPGKAHIKLAVHDDLSSIMIHNMAEGDDTWKDPIFGLEFKTEGSSKTLVDGHNMEIIKLGKEEFVGLDSTEVVGGIKADFTLGFRFDFQAAFGLEVVSKGVAHITPEYKELKRLKTNVTANSTRFIDTERLITQRMLNVGVASVQYANDLQAITKSTQTVTQKSIHVTENLVNVSEKILEAVEQKNYIVEKMTMDTGLLKMVAELQMSLKTIAMKIESDVLTIEGDATNIAGELLQIDGDLITINEGGDAGPVEPIIAEEPEEEIEIEPEEEIVNEPEEETFFGNLFDEENE